ncbi:MAG: hypothetical protein AAB364_01320 [Patescibacteria group bacterium]
MKAIRGKMNKAPSGINLGLSKKAGSKKLNTIINDQLVIIPIKIREKGFLLGRATFNVFLMKTYKPESNKTATRPPNKAIPQPFFIFDT